MNTKRNCYGTKKLLTDTFFELMKNKSMSRITVCELTKAAGVYRSTFYLYYDSIQDMVEEFEDALLKDMERFSVLTADAEITAEKIPQEFSDMLAYHLSIKNYLLALYGPNGDSKFLMEVNAMEKKYILITLKKTGHYFAEYQDYSIDFFVSGVQTIILHWLEDQDISIPDLATFIKKVLFSLPFLQ